MKDCANTYYINKHIEEIDKRDKEVELFLNSINNSLEAIEELASKIKEEAKECGLDEVAQEAINERV